MKKSFIITGIAAAFCYIALQSNTSGYRSNATGSAGAGTGAAQGCSCHGALNNNINVFVELDSAGSPVNHYTPGGNYTIKISGTNMGSASLAKYGFQLSVVKANSNPAGGSTMAGQPSAV